MNKQAETARASFVVTSNRGFAAYAQDELRTRMPGVTFAPLIANEVYRMDAPYDAAMVTSHLCDKQPIFVRHIHPIEAVVLLTGTEEDVERVAASLQQIAPWSTGQAVAVQARKAEGLSLTYHMGQALAERLAADGQLRLVSHDADWIASVFVCAEEALLGISRPADNLSDWAGGAVRFRKEEGQVSRAKFKLLEAERAFGLSFSDYRRALDIGAAPGGWTSLLLERGVEVTAVDPAEMDPRLLQHPQLTYLKRTADAVSFRPHTYDLLVCDMSWSPRQMVKCILPILDALRPGGDAVVTLKLMHGKPFQTVKDTVRAMGETMTLLHAKQLFHNRDELTLMLRKNG